MATYVGFSTQELELSKSLISYGKSGVPGTITQPPTIRKKFRLTDEQLVLRDFLNSFNIKQGDKVGQPDYGTNIWDFVFEANTTDNAAAIESEVRRVASLDSRILLNNVTTYVYENGVLIEVEIAFQPFNNALKFGFYLNTSTGVAEAMM